MMTCVLDAKELGLKLSSPLYVAVMEYGEPPTESDEVINVAVSPTKTTGACGTGLPPLGVITKITDPVGEPTPGRTEVTVEVNVIVCP